MRTPATRATVPSGARTVVRRPQPRVDLPHRRLRPFPAPLA
jgi:hypothetical protein